MKSVKNSTPPAPTPRFVGLVNRLAQEAGFLVHVAVEPLWPDDEPRIVATWRVSKEAFLRLKFLSPTARAKVAKGGIIAWPDRDEWHTVVYGSLRVDGPAVELRLSGGEVPRSIRTEGAIEITEYDDEIAHHGTKDALIAAGICTAKQFPDKNMRKSRADFSQPERQWRTRRYPDGSYVHSVETPETHARRLREAEEALAPPHRQDSNQAARPGTIDEFRGDLLAYIRITRSAMHRMLNDESNFYRLQPADIERLTKAWSEIQGIVENARILPRRFGVIEGGLTTDRHCTE